MHRHQNQGTMPTDAHARVGRTPRLVHGEDMNPAGAFVVDPDTQHLYAAYGRGNIPQLERQKLMTGITDDYLIFQLHETHLYRENHGRFLVYREKL